jgi:hypothetical protein
MSESYAADIGFFQKQQRAQAIAVGRENALAVKRKQEERAAERAASAKDAEGFLEDEKTGLISDLEKERHRRRECEKLAAEYRTQIAEREVATGPAARAATARAYGATVRAESERRKQEGAEDTDGRPRTAREPFRYNFFDHATDRRPKKPGIAFGTTKTFLTKMNDVNAVRAAMRSSLDREFADLEQEYNERKRLARERKESMKFHDVEKGSAEAEITQAHFRNAEVLREQIVEKQTRRELRLAEQRGEAHGYCGPDEKKPQSPAELASYRKVLLAQMETDRQRRKDRQADRILMEQQLAANATKEAAGDLENSGTKTRERKRKLKSTLEKQMLMQRLTAAVDKL